MGALRAPAGPDFRQADQGLSHFRETVDASLRLEHRITIPGHVPLVLVQFSLETCTSGGSTAFTAECHTPPVRPAAAGRTVFATWDDHRGDHPAPLDCHQALGRRASHLMTPLRSQLSMFGVETPRVATPATASALAVHGGASPIFQHRSGGCHSTEAIGAGFAWMSLLDEQGGRSGKAAPLRAAKHAHL